MASTALGAEAEAVDDRGADPVGLGPGHVDGVGRQDLLGPGHQQVGGGQQGGVLVGGARSGPGPGTAALARRPSSATVEGDTRREATGRHRTGSIDSAPDATGPCGAGCRPHGGRGPARPLGHRRGRRRRDATAAGTTRHHSCSVPRSWPRSARRWSTRDWPRSPSSPWAPPSTASARSTPISRPTPGSPSTPSPSRWTTAGSSPRATPCSPTRSAPASPPGWRWSPRTTGAPRSSPTAPRSAGPAWATPPASPGPTTAGRASWGPVKPGYDAPDTSATGLLVLAQAMADHLERPRLRRPGHRRALAGRPRGRGAHPHRGLVPPAAGPAGGRRLRCGGGPGRRRRGRGRRPPRERT